MIGKLNRIHLREVWAHEALDFNKWLEDNLDVLNETLDLKLTNAEREKEAGAFSVDLVAEDENGNIVVIENQLEKSDHDHLGKLITYVTALDAKTAIWIVSEPRQEHVEAISWLNERPDVSFYLVKVEAIKIDKSSPAPLLTKIASPSEEGRTIGDTKGRMAERRILYKRFWTQLMEYLKKTKTKLHANISPTEYHWIATGAGVSGLSYNYAITQHEAYVELYIDQGKDSEQDNLAIFEQLQKSQKQIDKTFGGKLEWEELENRRACRIRKTVTVGGYRDDAKRWPAIHKAMVDAMIRLEQALGPHIKKLKT